MSHTTASRRRQKVAPWTYARQAPDIRLLRHADYLRRDTRGRSRSRLGDALESLVLGFPLDEERRSKLSEYSAALGRIGRVSLRDALVGLLEAEQERLASDVRVFVPVAVTPGRFPPMTDEVVIVKGRLGWGNPGTGTACRFELYGPGDRWAPERPGQRVQGGDLIEDALAEAGATEGHQVLVIALGRYVNPAVLEAMEQAIRDGITQPSFFRPEGSAALAAWCICGHQRSEHLGSPGRGHCLFSTPTETFACICDEYRPAHLRTVLDPVSDPTPLPDPERYPTLARDVAAALAAAPAPVAPTKFCPLHLLPVGPAPARNCPDCRAAIDRTLAAPTDPVAPEEPSTEEYPANFYPADGTPGFGDRLAAPIAPTEETTPRAATWCDECHCYEWVPCGSVRPATPPEDHDIWTHDEQQIWRAGYAAGKAAAPVAPPEETTT